MKKKLITAALIVVCLSLSAYGSLAFFSTEEIAHNVITTGNLGIEVVEWADEEKTVPFAQPVEGVLPGSEVIKIAEIKNTGEGDAYVRVRVFTEVYDAQGKALEASPVVLDFNTDDWTLKDDYYYYNLPLKAHESSAPLFSKVVFEVTMDNRYQNAKAHIIVKAQAVQSANNGASVFDAIGWGAE